MGVGESTDCVGVGESTDCVGVGESTDCVRTECVAIAKIEMSGRFNHAGVERHKNTHT